MMTTEPGEALKIAEEKDVKERKGRFDPLRETLEGVNVFDHVCEKISAKVEDRVRLKMSTEIVNKLRDRGDDKKFRECQRAQYMIGTYAMIESNRSIEEREQIAHFRYPRYPSLFSVR